MQCAMNMVLVLCFVSSVNCIGPLALGQMLQSWQHQRGNLQWENA